MLQKLGNLLPVLLAVFIGGCTTAYGVYMVRPEPDSIKNGVTRYSQIVERFGIPWTEHAVVKNQKRVKIISYAYAPRGVEGIFVGGILSNARGLDFYLLNDVLVGHVFTSSMREDLTDFDDSKIGQIVKGRSTRTDVTALLGRPGGHFIYPMIETQSGEAAVYQYSQVSPGLFGPNIFWKSLVVTFDGSGLVTDVEYSSSAK